MATIPGVRIDITGASGSQGLLGPKDSWRLYVFPRGGYAAQDSTGTQITFDSAAIAGRFAVNDWVQAGLNIANIRQVSGVGGDSITVSGSALTITENDRIFLIGQTQPTTTGGSATYTTPATIVRQRDDDAADLYVNSMITTNSDGTAQFFSEPAVYDCLIQDGNRSNQGSIVNLPVGVAEGVSTSQASVFGATVTINAALGVTGFFTGDTVTVNRALGVTGWATFGSSVTMNAALGVTGTATFGASVTLNAALGVTGHATFGSTITGHANFGVTGNAVVGGSLTVSGGGATIAGGVSISSGLSISTGIFGVSQQPRCLLYASSATFAIGANSISVVWDQEAFDIGGLHTGTTSQIVIPTGYAGVYLLYGRLTGGSDVVGARNVYINKNATQTIAHLDLSPVSGAGAKASPSLTAIDYAAAGDRYELVGRYSAGEGVEGGTVSKSQFFAAKLF